MSGADNRINPNVAEKDSSSPALRQEKGFHKSRMIRAAAKAVKESFSNLNQKETAQKTIRTVARTTDGEKPTIAAYNTVTGTDASRPAFFPKRLMSIPARMVT